MHIRIGVLVVLWALSSFLARLDGPTWAQEQPRACEDQRAAFAVHIQILKNSRAQLESELSNLAVEADKLRGENARLKAEVAKARVSGQGTPQE